MIEVGQAAPELRLTDTNGVGIDSTDYHGSATCSSTSCGTPAARCATGTSRSWRHTPVSTRDPA